MTQNTLGKSVYNYIRVSLILIILPTLYLALWLTVSGDDSLTYFEQVQLLMSYFPESLRSPFWITFVFFGMCLTSAISSFNAYLKSKTKNTQVISVIICTIAVLLTTWFGMTLL